MVVLPPSGDVEFMAETIHWCQHSYLELGALASSVPCARKHAYLVAGEWGLAELAETLELIVSEITTNAVMASAKLTESRYLGQWARGVPPVRIWLYSDGQRVLVQVWDGNDQAPVPQQPDAEAESGRGLLLVETLSESWGTYALEGHNRQGDLGVGDPVGTAPPEAPWCCASMRSRRSRPWTNS